MLFGLLLATAAPSIAPGDPDALLCGMGAVYLAHSLIVGGEKWYFQAYNYQARYVRFNRDGNFIEGGGHYESRMMCQGKSLKELKAENRAFQFMSIMKDPLQFKDPLEYEDIKERWYKQFQSRLLRKIKKEGLRIGSRWRILAQTDSNQYFVVRDEAGSLLNNTRLALYPNLKVDLK